MSSDPPVREVERLHPLQRIARDYQTISQALGMAGNAMFFVGSIFFLFEPLKTAGIWLFIIGSFGMLVDSVGGKLVKSVDVE